MKILGGMGMENIIFKNIDLTTNIETASEQYNDNINDIRVEIDHELETALIEMQELESKIQNSDGKKFADQCLDVIENTIVSEFGIISMFLQNQDGGNVTTIHNAQQKIYADKKDEYDRKTYTNTKNSKGQKFAGDGKNSVGSNFTKSKMDKDGNVVDAYTGKIRQAKETSPDHIESISQFHKDGGFMLSDTKKADFATDEDNLALTGRDINTSMRDYSKEEWKDKKRENGKTNKEYFDIDEKLLNEAVTKGKNTSKKHLPTFTEKTKFYLTDVTRTGAREMVNAAKGAIFGILLKEISQIVISEIKIVFKNFGNEKTSEIIKRLKGRLVDKFEELKNTWKDIVSDIFKISLSAFFSNLIIMVINIFATTLKNTVKIIRAGFSSICSAIRIMAYPPRHIEKDDVMYEASKILITGIIGATCLGLSESVSKFLLTVPGLNIILNLPLHENEETGEVTTLAEPTSIVLTSIIGGIMSTVAVYYMDKYRREAKNDKIQIQLMTKSGEIVHMKAAQTWFVLGEAYDEFSNDVKQSHARFEQAKLEIGKSAKQASESVENFSKTIADFSSKLKQITKE